MDDNELQQLQQAAEGKALATFVLQVCVAFARCFFDCYVKKSCKFPTFPHVLAVAMPAIGVASSAHLVTSDWRYMALPAGYMLADSVYLLAKLYAQFDALEAVVTALAVGTSTVQCWAIACLWQLSGRSTLRYHSFYINVQAAGEMPISEDIQDCICARAQECLSSSGYLGIVRWELQSDRLCVASVSIKDISLDHAASSHPPNGITDRLSGSAWDVRKWPARFKQEAANFTASLAAHGAVAQLPESIIQNLRVQFEPHVRFEAMSREDEASFLFRAFNLLGTGTAALARQGTQLHEGPSTGELIRNDQAVGSGVRGQAPMTVQPDVYDDHRWYPGKHFEELISVAPSPDITMTASIATNLGGEPSEKLAPVLSTSNSSNATSWYPGKYLRDGLVTRPSLEAPLLSETKTHLTFDM